jgi:hypothetical protein
MKILAPNEVVLHRDECRMGLGYVVVKNDTNRGIIIVIRTLHAPKANIVTYHSDQHCAIFFAQLIK